MRSLFSFIHSHFSAKHNLCGFTINMLHSQYCACHGRTLSQEIKQKKLIPAGSVAVVSGLEGKGGKLKIIVMYLIYKNLLSTVLKCIT